MRVGSTFRKSRWPLTVAALLAIPSICRANGRFPAANQLAVDADEPEHFLLRATYGLLVSHDAGASFRWICEDVLGDVGESDPAVAIFHNGELVTAAQDRLLTSDTAGCSFVNALSQGASEFPVDVSTDPGDATRVLAIARAGDGSGDVHLLEINDESTVAHLLGASLGSDLFPLTLDAAPSDSRRIYVTALSTEPASVLLRSDDRGESWQRFPITPEERLQAYIAAVDPQDADRVYLRLNDEPNDHLLVSTDAGEHFNEVPTLPSKLLGFALSPDGSSIAIGGPGVPLQIGKRSELTFVAAGAPFSLLSCLKWTDAGLFACADDRADGFTLGLSSDEGESFVPLFHARELAPLVCDTASDVGSSCPRVWPSVEATLAPGAAASNNAGASSPTSTERSAPASAGCSVTRGARGAFDVKFAIDVTALAFWLLLRWRRGRRSPRAAY